MTLSPPLLRIRALRMAASLSQDQLADLAGLTRSHLSEIETGATPANTLRLDALARALGVAVPDLFDTPREPWAAEIMALMSRLTPEERESILRTVRAMAAARVP